jgi:hypothetical protein
LEQRVRSTEQPGKTRFEPTADWRLGNRSDATASAGIAKPAEPNDRKPVITAKRIPDLHIE